MTTEESIYDTEGKLQSKKTTVSGGYSRPEEYTTANNDTVGIIDENTKEYPAPSIDQWDNLVSNKLEIPEGFPVMREGSVLVKPFDYTQKTPSGIILPPVSDDKKAGIIWAIGPKAYTEGLRVGHYVVYNAFANSYITYDMICYIMMHTSDVFAILPSTDIITGNQDLGRKRRPDIDVDKLPTNKATKDELEENTENFIKKNEEVAKEVSKKVYGPNK